MRIIAGVWAPRFYGIGERDDGGIVFNHHGEWIKAEVGTGFVDLHWSSRLDGAAAFDFMSSAIGDSKVLAIFAWPDRQKEVEGIREVGSKIRADGDALSLLSVSTRQVALQWRLTSLGHPQFGWLGSPEDLEQVFDLVGPTASDGVRAVLTKNSSIDLRSRISKHVGTMLARPDRIPS